RSERDLRRRDDADRSPHTATQSASLGLRDGPVQGEGEFAEVEVAAAVEAARTGGARESSGPAGDDIRTSAKVHPGGDRAGFVPDRERNLVAVVSRRQGLIVLDCEAIRAAGRPGDGD